MKKAEVKIQFATPCIMGGADRQSAEFRAASVRDALRWWMRALGYGCEQVNALFGVAAGDKGIRSNSCGTRHYRGNAANRRPRRTATYRFE